MQVRPSKSSVDTTAGTSLERSLLSRLRRGTVEAFVLNGVGIGVIFVMHFVLGRAIGAAGYGVFSYAISLVTVLAAVLPLGWPTALLRFVAQYLEQRDWGLLKGVIRRAHQTTFVSAVFGAIALFAVSFWSRISPDLVISFRFASLLLLPVSFVTLRSKTFLGFQRVRASVVLEQIVLPAFVIVGVLLLEVTSASGALLVYSAVAFLVFFIGSIWLWRTIPVESRKTTPKYQTRFWMYVALPSMFGGIGQMLLNRVDVLIIGAMLDPEAAGLYSAANRIAKLNAFSLGAVSAIASPMLAAAFHSNRPNQFQTIMRDAMLWSTLGSIPAFALAILFPYDVLSFLGSEFAQAAILLRILAAGQFVNAATGPVAFALTMTGREQVFARIMIFAALATVFGDIIAIRIWGVTGAAIVTSLTVALSNGIMYLQARNVPRAMTMS